MESENTIVHEEGSVHLNKVLSGSFAWMTLGLFISAVVSIVTAILLVLNPILFKIIFSTSIGFIACFLIEIALVIYLTRRINKMSVFQARASFVLYTLVSGITLSIIFFAFSTLSIISIFFGTALMFAALAIYGKRTKKDLSKIGRLAIFGLFGLVIAMLINMLIGSSLIDYILACVGVVVFTILISYDVQKIKKLAGVVNTPEEIKKASILGALSLYLDFINLFLNFLRIFGRRK